MGEVREGAQRGYSVDTLIHTPAPAAGMAARDRAIGRPVAPSRVSLCVPTCRQRGMSAVGCPCDLCRVRGKEVGGAGSHPRRRAVPAAVSAAVTADVGGGAAVAKRAAATVAA